MEKDVERLSYIEIIIALLAVFSITLVIIDLTFDLTEYQRVIFRWIDLGIVIIFWIEFVFILTISKNRWLFTKKSWADIIGMMPVTEITFAFIRVFRIFRITRILRISRTSKIEKIAKNIRRIMKRL